MCTALVITRFLRSQGVQGVLPREGLQAVPLRRPDASGREGGVPLRRPARQNQFGSLCL